MKRSDGTELENATFNILRLFPGASVRTQMELSGKKVDLLCTLPAHLMPSFRIAVECKDWTRPLTRQQCASIIAEYNPLLESKQIDQFLLVTKNGIVPSAKKIFDSRKYQHLTFAELGDKVIDPLPLVDNMIRQYKNNGLSQYYIEQSAMVPDLSDAIRNYELTYNQFIDFALDNEILDYSKAKADWQEYYGAEIESIIDSYDKTIFDKVIEVRRSLKIDHLESYIESWLSINETPHGLALIGTYGTGKSCFAKRIAYICALKYKQNPLSRIPFLIELKEFGSHQDIKGLITHELVNRHGVANGSYELFQSLNEAGRFFIILDGFDEMKQGMTADSIIYNFNQLAVLHCQRSKILLCGRPTVFENQNEQNRILSGGSSFSVNQRASYIQITVAPFNVKEVCRFLVEFTKYKYPKSLLQMTVFVKELRRELGRESDWRNYNYELEHLVSRPVHLPMLASVLPRKRIAPKDLRRSVLYDEFINIIIEREMLKRRPEFQKQYSIASRRKFAKLLAVEMCKRGESRTIRTSEIPDTLISEFITPSGPSSEAVRRDLVTACFLDRKPPDILFIPHKSFLEYLAAEYLAELIEIEDVPKTDKIGYKISEEIFSFAAEIVQEKNWVKLSLDSANNIPLITMWLAFLRKQQWSLPVAVEERWENMISEFPTKLRENLVNYYEERDNKNSTKVLSHAAISILTECLKDDSDVISVHAYRALNKSGHAMSLGDLLDKLGVIKLLKWFSYDWLRETDENREQLFSIARQLMVSQFYSYLQNKEMSS